MQEVLEKVREVTHVEGGVPNPTTFIFNMVPSVGMSIVIGLLVPLCGYLGVKQNQQFLVGCFCSCNALQCCCAMMSMVCLCFLGWGLAAMAPSVELFLEKCDPIQCTVNATGQAHIVDCLATGVWKDYQPRFPGYHFPGKGVCPPFLQCGSPPKEIESYDEQPFGGDFQDVDAPAREVGMGDYSSSLAADLQMPRDRFGTS
jgi:hypothetical protein